MIHLYLGSTTFRVAMDTKGMLTEYAYDISSYVNLFREVDFDYKLRRYVTANLHTRYSKLNNSAYFPRHGLPILTNRLKKDKIPYTIVDVPTYKWDPITLELKDGIRDKDERQTKAIDFVLKEDIPMCALELQVGAGKTYCAIKTISLLGRKTLIIADGVKLSTQWIDSLYKFTNIKEREICDISTRNKLYQLAKSKYDHDYKVYLCSTGILRNAIYDEANVEEQYVLDNILNRLHIGYTILDEAHRAFASTSIYMLGSNVDRTLFLSATLFRSNRDSKKIFNIYFPEHIRFRAEKKVFLDVYAYTYNIGHMPLNKVSTNRGYSQLKYEAYILSKPDMFKSVMDKIVNCIHAHFINVKKENQKCLIFFSRIDFIDSAYVYLLKQNLNEKIGVYYSGVNDSVFVDSDIILSTPGSCGTGIDTPNLKTAICFVSRGSKVENEQIPGRLRQLKDDTPIFVYMTNTAITSQRIHASIRKDMYSVQAKRFFEYEI